MPNINSLQTELQTVPNFDGYNNQVLTLTAPVSCVPTVQIAPTYNLARKPAASALSLGASSFTAGVLTPDAAGLYQIVVTNAGAAGPTFQILALPGATLARFGAGAIQRFMANQFFSAASCAASVEGAAAAVGGFLGIDARLLGGPVAVGIPAYLFQP